jgi:DNA-binding transcriptional ArsR family regulator
VPAQPRLARLAPIASGFRTENVIDGSSDCCPPEPEVIAPSNEDVEIAILAKALGHPIRVRILRILLGQDACFCGELVELLPLAQATVSQHLKVLADAGLIRGETDGPRVCYCANRQRLRQIAGLIDTVAETAVSVLEGVA